ncbi:MAG: hypothetical protein R3C05_04625 [Pirellulaceae bacterium]
MHYEQPTQRSQILREAMHKTYGTALLHPKPFDINSLFDEQSEQKEIVVSLGLVMLWTAFLLVSFVAIHIILTSGTTSTERFEVNQTSGAYTLTDGESGRRWQFDSRNPSSEWIAVNQQAISRK